MSTRLIGRGVQDSEHKAGSNGESGSGREHRESRFNPQTGAYLGTQKVNATVQVAKDGETFSAVSISELRDPAGTVVLSGLRGTAVGTRIHVEQIPDRP
jgi:hypothetical protein